MEMKRNKVLVTGGLGFIGSHTVVSLIEKGFEVVIIDNLSNAKLDVLDSIQEITGKRPTFYNFDLLNKTLIQKVFEEQIDISMVVHFAALKSVGESQEKPLLYFSNNITSLINILELMQDYNIKTIIFSSSATVYGEVKKLPITEDTAFGEALSAYASTKQICEEILQKVCKTNKINSIILRYFNPVGAHQSAKIGEFPNGVPNNLMPFITQTAIGKLETLSVFGDDFDTPDKFAVRDYIHVVDLAIAHVKACEYYLDGKMKQNVEIFNIGTGKGYSVMEVLTAFERVNDTKVPFKIVSRRQGDTAMNYADATKSKNELAWEATLNLDDMVKDAWRWEKALSQNLKSVSKVINR